MFDMASVAFKTMRKSTKMAVRSMSVFRSFFASFLVANIDEKSIVWSVRRASWNGPRRGDAPRRPRTAFLAPERIPDGLEVALGGAHNRPKGVPGGPWTALGRSWDAPGSAREASETSLGRPEGPQGRPEPILERFWFPVRAISDRFLYSFRSHFRVSASVRVTLPIEL